MRFNEKIILFFNSITMAIKKYQSKKKTNFNKKIKSIVKSEINKDVETKIFNLGSSVSSALATQTVYSLNPLSSIVAGTGVNQRIGQEINLKNLNVRILIQNTSATVRQTTYYRIMVLWHESAYTTSWAYSGTALGSSELFHSSSNLLTSPPNRKLGLTLLKDKLMAVRAQTSNAATQSANQTTLNINIPFKNKKVGYVPGTTYLKQRQLYVVVIPGSADVGLISGVSAVGSIDICGTVSYTDA
jgi:hypothetical protein